VRRLVLVRHGQSEWNEQRRVQGHSGTGLTERGRVQAQHTARWVLATHPGAVLVSSDLQRCAETATALAEAMDVVPVLDSDVRERAFGRWEGLTMAEVEELDPDLWARWRTGVDVIRQVGGESGVDLAARVVPAYRRHVENLADGQTVVIVTHGGPVWHGLHALLDLPRGTLGGVGNAAVTEVVLDETGWWCESWNQTAHLPADLRTTFRPSETRTEASKA